MTSSLMDKSLWAFCVNREIYLKGKNFQTPFLQKRSIGYERYKFSAETTAYLCKVIRLLLELLWFPGVLTEVSYVFACYYFAFTCFQDLLSPLNRKPETVQTFLCCNLIERKTVFRVRSTHPLWWGNYVDGHMHSYCQHALATFSLWL